MWHFKSPSISSVFHIIASRIYLVFVYSCRIILEELASYTFSPLRRKFMAHANSANRILTSSLSPRSVIPWRRWMPAHLGIETRSGPWRHRALQLRTTAERTIIVVNRSLTKEEVIFAQSRPAVGSQCVEFWHCINQIVGKMTCQLRLHAMRLHCACDAKLTRRTRIAVAAHRSSQATFAKFPIVKEQALWQLCVIMAYKRVTTHNNVI